MNENIPTEKAVMPPLGGLERRLLVLTACLELDEDRAVELKELLQGKVDWDTVIAYSSMHGTAGIIYRHLLNISADNSVPEDVLERMRSIYLVITASNMQYLEQSKILAEQLAAEGLEIIFLKGSSLIESLYEDLGYRAMSDIDILVRERDWPSVSRILNRLEYRPGEKIFSQTPPKLTKYDVQAHIQYLSKNGVCLEFQFDLFTLGIGMRDIEGVWERSRQLSEDSLNVRTLSPEDQLLQMIIHVNRHGFMRLKWLIDITESVRRGDEIDWELFVKIARKEKIQPVVYLAIDYISKVFDFEIAPWAVMEQLKPKFYKRAIWKAVWPRKQLDEFNGRNEDVITFYFYRPFCVWNLFNYLLMGRALDKLYYQIRWIVPPMKWMAATYDRPESLELLKYYPKRMVNYGKRKTKTGL